MHLHYFANLTISINKVNVYITRINVYAVLDTLFLYFKTAQAETQNMVSGSCQLFDRI